MTVTCPSENCALCRGDTCVRCGEFKCGHSPSERHHRIGVVLDEARPDETVVEEPDPKHEPSVNRVATKPMPPVDARDVLAFEISDQAAVADFFTAAASILRMDGPCRIVIIVERVKPEKTK